MGNKGICPIGIIEGSYSPIPYYEPVTYQRSKRTSF